MLASDLNSSGNEGNLMAQWSAERCPIIDGVVFGDGRVRLVAADWQSGQSGRLELVIKPGGWTTLAELQQKGQLQWTDVIALCEVEDQTRGIRLIGGEGGLGSDGFVANVCADDGRIIWIAFFTNSNPFELVSIRGDNVVAKTNHGTWWQFPLANPDQVTLL